MATAPLLPQDLSSGCLAQGEQRPWHLMHGQMTRTKMGCREQEWVRKPKVNKYPNYTKRLELTLNPLLICSHFPHHVAASMNPCINSFLICYNKESLHTVNWRIWIMQRWDNWHPSNSSSLHDQTCVLHSSPCQLTVQQHSRKIATVQEGDSLLPQGRREKERHRGRISSLTYSK